MARALIHDTLTLDGRTEAHGAFPSVLFSFRPAVPEQVYEYRETRKRALTGRDVLGAVLGLLLKHLVSWDVTDLQDNAVPLNKENLRQVPEPTLEQMVAHVLTYAGEGRLEGDRKNLP